LDVEIRAYCKKAEALHATLPVAGFATQLKVPIDIEEIYIPLHAMLDLRGVADEAFLDADHAEKALQQRDAGLEISIPEAFCQSEKRGYQGIVILGDPGSGKTTHLKRLLLWCLRGGPEMIGLPAEMLPVFLPLRNLSKLDQGLDDFIQQQLANKFLKTAPGFGERLLQRENLLLLLDGLDEVADPDQRQQVGRWIMDALRYHPSCRSPRSRSKLSFTTGITSLKRAWPKIPNRPRGLPGKKRTNLSTVCESRIFGFGVSLS
jgi:hypothetical protein